MTELIAEDERKTGGEGGGTATDLFNLFSDLSGDADGWETGMDTALVAIDVLSNAANPLGGLISAGVGWLLEHIPGISDIWDKLMGDASAIEQIAKTWENISKSLGETGKSFGEASKEIESWEGKAKQSYTNVAKAFEASVSGAAIESEALAIVVRLIGGICAGLKDVIYTLIAEFIEFTVLPAILSALATSWCTFGGSIAAAITYIEIQADITAEQITVKITRVTEEITILGERATKIVAKLDKMISKLKELKETLEEGTTVAKHTAKEVGKGVGKGEVEQGKEAGKTEEEGGEPKTENGDAKTGGE
jgi:methyl-accepting chemotaxis protein